MAANTPVTQDLVRLARDHEALSRLLRRTGIVGFSPETEEGKTILAIYQAFLELGHKDRPDIVKQIGAEVATLNYLMIRSLSTTLIIAKGPSGRDSKIAAAKRAAFKMASGEYHKYLDDMPKALKLLGVEGFADLDGGGKEKGAFELLKELAEREKHALPAALDITPGVTVPDADGAESARQTAQAGGTCSTTET